MIVALLYFIYNYIKSLFFKSQIKVPSEFPREFEKKFMRWENKRGEIEYIGIYICEEKSNGWYPSHPLPVEITSLCIVVCRNRDGTPNVDLLPPIPEQINRLALYFESAYSNLKNTYTFNHYSLPRDYIPKTVTDLSIEILTSNLYDIFIGDYIPSSVATLSVPSVFPEMVKYIPSSVHHLTVKKQRSSVDNLIPSFIESLDITFTKYDGQEKSIPNTVKTLSINGIVKRQEKECPTIYTKTTDQQEIPANTLSLHWVNDIAIRSLEIPTSVTHIEFYDFNKPISQDQLPDSITSIKFKSYNQSLSLINFPTNLRYLALVDFDQMIYGNTQIPMSTVYLEVRITRKNGYSNNWLLKRGYIPESIRFLKINIGETFLFENIIVPSSIQFVDIDPFYKNRVIFLEKDIYYKDPIASNELNNGGAQHVFCNKLVSLDLGDCFNQQIKMEMLPPTLTQLYYGRDYTQEVVVPSSVTDLSLMSLQNQIKISPGSILPKIKHLTTRLPLYQSTDFSSILDPTTTVLDCFDVDFLQDKTFELTKPLPNTRKLILRLNRFNNVFESLSNQQFFDSTMVEDLSIENESNIYGQPNHLIETFPNLTMLSLHYNGRSIELSNLSSSIKQLKIMTKDPVSPDEIPGFVQDLSLYLDDSNYQYFLINQDKDNNETIEPQTDKPLHFITINSIDNESFFKIYRNISLKRMIQNFIDDMAPSFINFNYHESRSEILSRANNYDNLIIKTKNTIVSTPNIKGLYLSDKVNDLSEIHPNTTTLGCHYDLSIIVPPWITKLYIFSIESIDKVDWIPPSVTYLGLKKANQEPFKIPDTVTTLHLHSESQELLKVIPASVRILKLDFCLTLSFVFQLPKTIEKLIFKEFHLIDTKIPKHPLISNHQIYNPSKPVSKKITHLVWNCSKDVERDIIPNNVHTIIFCHSFDNHIHHLPDSVTDLRFYGRFDQHLSNVYFPPNLKFLTFGSQFTQPIYKPLPCGLKYLCIGNIPSYNNIPETVSLLKITSFRKSFSLPPPPPHIRYLSFNEHVDIAFNEIPKTCKSIVCSTDKWTAYNDNVLAQDQNTHFSQSQLHLYTKYCFNSLIKPHTLIKGIKSIVFDKYYNQILYPHSIPDTVDTVVFGREYNQVINSGVLPDSITHLEFGVNFKHNLSKQLLPAYLKTLIIKRGYYHDDLLQWLPASVQELELGDELLSNRKLFPIDKVPSHITSLILNESEKILSPSMVPPTITNLKLCKCINYDGKLPLTITSLSLSQLFNSPLESILTLSSE
ncbi:hypothetical protein CYY_002036 [Polysphondylium violaceum]|uniref:FNIP repeat-containing protein n=1 Tax=Polysphondylium violaceum TaxID=133409 RepID=A0A8J4UVK4_9MYCE|nr:hypothetical protein CYY_002036 [Polysphondylium violaceum]